jgi:pyridoxine 5'-phosphate synthase PdxJ
MNTKALISQQINSNLLTYGYWTDNRHILNQDCREISKSFVNIRWN